MSAKFSQHPIFTFTEEISDICKPLRTLDISYFSHVNVNKHAQFSAIGTNPKFTKYYFENELYNNDIASNINELGDHVIWDLMPRCVQTEQMYKEAALFDIRHNFTIIHKEKEETNCYHFSTHINNRAFNQTYLSNIDLLNKFIQHFRGKVNASKHLLSAYDMKFELTEKSRLEDFGFKETNSILELEKKRKAFSSHLEVNSPRLKCAVILHKNTLKPITLAPQQMRCLLLLLGGKTNKEIARILHISYRTVEHHVDRIKDLLKVRNSKQLLINYIVQDT